MGMYAEIDGLRLYYEVHGSGRPIVLLHGGLLTIEYMFEPWIPRLVEAGHQVIAVELQGHGRTADIDRPFSVDRMADDVVGLLDELGLKQADVLGFSLGGMVGYSLVVRHPARVGRHVVVSSDYCGRDTGTEPAGPLPTEADFAAMRAAYEAVAPDPAHFETFAGRLSTMVNEEFVGWTPDDLRAVAHPTLVVVGDNDFTSVADALEASKLMPNAHLAVLPDTTHMDMTRRPDLLLAVILPFLGA